MEALREGRRSPRRRGSVTLPGGAEVRCREVEVALTDGGKVKALAADLCAQPQWLLVQVGDGTVLYPLARVASVTVRDGVASGSAGPNPVLREIDPSLLRPPPQE